VAVRSDQRGRASGRLTECVRRRPDRDIRLPVSPRWRLEWGCVCPPQPQALAHRSAITHGTPSEELMSSAPTYQVAFKFQFQQDLSGQPVLINIVDSNQFVLKPGEKIQLQPYFSNSTPPLSDFSLSDQQLYFNIGNAEADTGVESIVWATFTNGANAQTLTVELQTQTGLIASSYQVLNTGSSGALRAGNNTISVTQ
jgi:hypothetical protein